jgi:hypothetical protein
MDALCFTTGISNMKSVPARILLLLAVTLLPAACGTIDNIKDKQLGNDLQVVLSRYESAVRWGNPQHAYGFLKPELAEQTPLPPGLENIEVSQYVVVSPPVLLNKTTATQTVGISYILVNRQVEHSLVDRQMWERKDEDSREWYRANPIPEFK